MKVKELDKTVNLAWSPAQEFPILLAAGTAAQQLDASFSTSAALELYGLNINEPGPDLELKASTPSQHRFHKVAWGGWGNGREGAHGVVVGGCDNGRLQMYSVGRLLSGEEGLIVAQDRHTGPVRAVDFNAYQKNLLASGASESEIFIWDLNNTTTPMTPGAKSQPAEDVVWLSWNKQVQHILASTFPTRCVVWDLRKNEPIIKLTDNNSRIRWKVVAWHPDVATQLCLASEEDANPVIQLWDLRFATTPLKTLEGHHRGVLSIAWCAQDPDLLISCGKDNRILCWNPNATDASEEIVCELATSNQWNFEVTWCPRNPSLVASSSFDGHASIYSLTGSPQQIQTTNKIADSFPGVDQFAQAPPVVKPPHSQVIVELRKAPKWLRRPAAASFAFGGKLVTFNSESRSVVISQVVTEPALLERSHNLQEALNSGRFGDLCLAKNDIIWQFVGASLQIDYRTAMRTLLGFSQEQLEVSKFVKQQPDDDVGGLTNDFGNLNQNGPSDIMGNFTNSLASESAFDAIQNNTMFPVVGKRTVKTPVSFKICTGDDTDGIICKALLSGNIEIAVELCLQEGRTSDAIILAMTGGPDLLAKTQYKYFQQSKGYLSQLISAVVTEEWEQVVMNCDLSSWAEALAALLTYAKDEELPKLCELLGQRLETEVQTAESKHNAEICYIAAGNLGRIVQNRTLTTDISTSELQDLVELVLIAKKGEIGEGKELAHLLVRYAKLLASQGDLSTAVLYLGDSQEEEISELRDRLYIALGHKQLYSAPVTPARQPTSYYQNTMQQQFAPGYGKSPLVQTSSYGVTQPVPQQPPIQAAAKPFTPASFPPPVQQQQPPAQSFLPPGSQSYPPPSFSAGSRSFSPPSTSAPSFQTQPSLFKPPTSVSSAFVTPPSKPYTPTGLPPRQSQTTPVHFNTSGGVPPPPPTSAVPPTALHRSSPSPSPGQGLASGRKYVLDPSVSGGPAPYSRSSQQFNPGFSSGLSQSYGAPPTQPYTTPPSQTFGTIPQAPQTSLGQPFNPSVQQPYTTGAAPQMFNPPSAPPPITNQPVSQMQPQSQPTYGAQPYNSPGEPPKPQLFNPHQQSAPGWNDPPVLTSSRNPPKTDLPPQAPITHPLFGVNPQEMQQPHMGTVNGGYGDNTYSQYGYAPNVPPPPPAAPGPQQQQQPAPVAPAKIAEPPQPKPPLPEEHMYLQTVFEELRDKCAYSTKNPQLKRKLEDVARKLEVLYDCLRDAKLSAVTLETLHQMVQLVQHGDYTGALGLHTQLVSGPDFSQISSFMPGLKVLIQSALQLGVYLQ